MICYKLTDAQDRTHGDCQWGEGVTHEADGAGELCTSHWLHAYSDPLLGVLLNQIHGKFDLATAHMWRCDAEGWFKDNRGLKFGATKITTIERVELPEVTTEQRVRFAIACAWQVYKWPQWRDWARRWLGGTDRSCTTAAPHLAAYAAAAYAAHAAYAYAANAADAAVDAIDLAALAHWALTDSVEVPDALLAGGK